MFVVWKKVLIVEKEKMPYGIKEDTYSGDENVLRVDVTLNFSCGPLTSEPVPLFLFFFSLSLSSSVQIYFSLLPDLKLAPLLLFPLA
ncbi:hypothetical protein QVD17_00701 [Tagetes erecta]|uniref:Uncharacterized protein n=1 Tax=Tagetes erecta TaxID=13708 RepID=A0AAD8L9A4_TARER|nr:hypothetical protein QVD17_00701 [Tagetes erecta]